MRFNAGGLLNEIREGFFGAGDQVFAFFHGGAFGEEADYRFGVRGTDVEPLISPYEAYAVCHRMWHVFEKLDEIFFCRGKIRERHFILGYRVAGNIRN